MSKEDVGPHETIIDVNLLSALLRSEDFKKKLTKGFRIMAKKDEESAFSVALTKGDEIAFSSLVEGFTKVYAKSVDDAIINGYLKRSIVKLNEIRFREKGITRLADFHFHPNGDTNPSYNDANTLVGRVYRRTSEIPVHKSFFGGIFAGVSENKSCLFYGLGRDGLVSNHYQAWNALNKASGFQNAMKQSGFWIEKGTFRMTPESIEWEDGFVDRLANSLRA